MQESVKPTILEHFAASAAAESHSPIQTVFMKHALTVSLKNPKRIDSPSNYFWESPNLKHTLISLRLGNS